MNNQAITREELIGASHPERVSEVKVFRYRRYPQVARPGPAWVWLYSYKTVDPVDGIGPEREYGTGLADTRSWLKRTFPAAKIAETWK